MAVLGIAYFSFGSISAFRILTLYQVLGVGNGTAQAAAVLVNRSGPPLPVDVPASRE